MVVLQAVGEKKIEVIREVRVLTRLGLKEAKDLVEGVPKIVKEGGGRNEARRSRLPSRRWGPQSSSSALRE